MKPTNEKPTYAKASVGEGGEIQTLPVNESHQIDGGFGYLADLALPVRKFNFMDIC